MGVMWILGEWGEVKWDLFNDFVKKFKFELLIKLIHG